MAEFEGKKSSNDIIINDIMSEGKEVASDVPPRYLLDLLRLLNGLKLFGETQLSSLTIK